MKWTMKRKIIIAALGLTFIGCEGGMSLKNVNLDSDESKFSYAVGYEIGKNLNRQGVELDYKAFNKAIMDVMEDKQESLTSEQRREIMTKISKKQREERKKAAEMNQTKVKNS